MWVIKWIAKLYMERYRWERCPTRYLKGDDPQYPDCECVLCKARWCYDYLFNDWKDGRTEETPKEKTKKN